MNNKIFKTIYVKDFLTDLKNKSGVSSYDDTNNDFVYVKKLVEENFEISGIYDDFFFNNLPLLLISYNEYIDAIKNEYFLNPGSKIEKYIIGYSLEQESFSQLSLSFNEDDFDNRGIGNIELKFKIYDTNIQKLYEKSSSLIFDFEIKVISNIVKIPYNPNDKYSYII